MSQKSKKPKEWREFEKLVGRIERAAAGTNATVTCPDRVPDLVTGTMREVDATVRYKIGTVPILIAIECRRRGAVQDVTWIEQLATKGASIGASKTIAVAWKGFSEEAKKQARLKGIELRQLGDMDPSDLPSWLIPQSMIHEFRRYEQVGNVGIVFRLRSGDPPHTKPSPAHLRKQKEQKLDAKLFMTEAGLPLSINDLWLKAQTELYADVPRPGGGRIRKTPTLKLPEGELFMETTEGPRDVAEITIPVELWYEREEVKLEDGRFHRYTDQSGGEIQRVEFRSRLRELEIGLAFQSVQGARDVTFEMTVTKSVRDN